MVDIVARKSLSYAGKRVAAGQTFPATQTHAKLLIRLGKAAMPAPEAQTQPNRTKSKKELKKERKAYKTRALTAETGKGG